MTKKSIQLGKRVIDSCDYLTLVSCPDCHWRSEGRTKGHAWYLLARHLKDHHGDFLAFKTAERNAYRNGYHSTLRR